MANEEKQYTADFKTKIAEKAIAQDKQNLERLSDEYDVPVSTILTWIVAYEKGTLREDPIQEDTESKPEDDSEEVVDLEINDSELAESFRFGAMRDNLNYRRLFFWCILGVVLFFIFVESLRQMYFVNEQLTLERKAEQSQFRQINDLRNNDRETLNSFGVVDEEEGIYRIPIDSAINELADGE